MLDLPGPQAPAMPLHWRLAPVPDAPLYQAATERLVRGGGHEFLAASPALLAALTAPAAPGGVLRAYDSSGAAWRLRHAGGAAAQAWWQVQSLADSRGRLFDRLRSLLARQLHESVLHELRSPLNALSLHTDLITRLLDPGTQADATARALHSAAVLRERLGELGARQDAAVALWLGEGADAGENLAAIVRDGLRLLRGLLAAQGVLLRAAELEALADTRLPCGAAAARIALLALLLAAGAGARLSGAAEVTVLGAVDHGAPVLEVQAPLEAQALGRELAGTDGNGLLAALALLFEPCGLHLETSAELALSRLTLAPNAMRHQP